MGVRHAQIAAIDEGADKNRFPNQPDRVHPTFSTGDEYRALARFAAARAQEHYPYAGRRGKLAKSMRKPPTKVGEELAKSMRKYRLKSDSSGGMFMRRNNAK